MSTITVQMPEGLAAQLRKTAETAGVSLDQFLSSAAAEKLSAWQTLEHLRTRASRAKREDFIAFLDQSPDAPPLSSDE
jgi:uncharacterized protein (DUF1778 family)